MFTVLLPEKLSSTVQTVFPGITKRLRQTAWQRNEVNFTYSLGPQSRAVTLIAESWAAKGHLKARDGDIHMHSGYSPLLLFSHQFSTTGLYSDNLIESNSSFLPKGHLQMPSSD